MKALSYIKNHNLLFFLYFVSFLTAAGPVYSYLIKAEEVRIQDAGGYFIADTVEEALQQMGSAGATGTNWDAIPWSVATEADLTGVNWDDYANLGDLTASVNWDAIPWSVATEADLTGVNWADYANLGDIGDLSVNWAEMPLIMSAGVNWTDFEALAPINSGAVNWDSMTDLASGGVVTNNSHLHTASTNASVVLTVCSSTSTQFACDYTADGTDDDVQIQAALDALPATGGTVLLSEGVFNINASIEMDDYLGLIGQGYPTHLKAQAATNAPVIKETVSAVGITIKNLRADGDKANQTTAFSTIDLTGVTYSTFDNLWVDNALRTGTYPTVSSDGEGIVFRNSSFNIISKIYARNNAYDGIKLRNADYNVLSDLNCVNNGKTCLQISYQTAAANSSDYNVVSNVNVYHETGTPDASAQHTGGVYVHGGHQNVVSGITVYGAQQGIGMTEAASNNVFSDAFIRFRYSSDAIAALTVTSTGLYNNQFNNISVFGLSGNNGKFINVASGSTGNTVKNSLFSDGPGTGTWTVTLGTGNYYHNNIFNEATTGDCSNSRCWNNIGMSDGVVGGANDTYDLGASKLEIPNSTSLPGTCAVGQIYMDTDATSGQRLYLCESANTWALQGDGTSALGADAVQASSVNWDDMTDLGEAGTVVWANLAEGELATGVVVSDDIKDGTIAGADLATNIAITSTGAQDYGGAASFEIPQDKTVDTDGQITIDGTTGQFRYHDGTAQRVLTWNERKCFGWFSPADADDDIEVWTFKYAATVTNISCRVSGGTSIAVVGGDGTNNFESITCDADSQADDGSITNATFTAGEVLELDLGAPSGTVPSFTYCIDFTNTAD